MTERTPKVNDPAQSKEIHEPHKHEPDQSRPYMGQDGTGGYGKDGPTSAASPTGGLGIGKGDGYPFAK